MEKTQEVDRSVYARSADLDSRRGRIDSNHVIVAGPQAVAVADVVRLEADSGLFEGQVASLAAGKAPRDQIRDAPRRGATRLSRGEAFTRDESVEKDCGCVTTQSHDCKRRNHQGASLEQGSQSARRSKRHKVKGAIEHDEKHEEPSAAAKIYEIVHKSVGRWSGSSQLTVVSMRKEYPPWEELPLLANFKHEGFMFRRGDTVDIYCTGQQNQAARICDIRQFKDDVPLILIAWFESIGHEISKRRRKRAPSAFEYPRKEHLILTNDAAIFPCDVIDRAANQDDRPLIRDYVLDVLHDRVVRAGK